MEKEKIKETYLNLYLKLRMLLDERKRQIERLFEKQLRQELNLKLENHWSYADEGLERECNELNQKITDIEQKIEQISQEAIKVGFVPPFEMLANKHNLTKEEKYILMTLYFGSNFDHFRIRGETLIGEDLLANLGYKPSELILKSGLLNQLINKNLVFVSDEGQQNLLQLEYCLTEEVNTAINEAFGINASQTESRTEIFLKKSKPEKRADTDLLLIQDPIITFDTIILDQTKMQEIEQRIFQAQKLPTVLQQWGFSETIKYGRGVTMLFWGPSGTGKTATAHAIAHRLGKKIGIVRLSQIRSKWFGESEKNLARVFNEAKKVDCVLFFDEAEAIFGKRLQEYQSIDRAHNLMTNLLMQEIEKFEGVLILTTNHAFAMDEAFERRILLKLKFDIPGPNERAKIWRALIPAKAPLAADVDFDELGRKFELTGGEIKNAVLNAVNECTYFGENKITMARLSKSAEKEFTKVIRKRSRKLRKVGFVQ